MFDKAAGKILRPINTMAVSILGVFNILMGLWISLPFDSLHISNSVPEWIISAGMLVVGVFVVIGAFGERYRTLVIGAQLSFYYWFCAMLGLILVNWHDPSWIVALMIAAYSLFVAINIKVNRDNLPFKKQ